MSTPAYRHRTPPTDAHVGWTVPGGIVLALATVGVAASGVPRDANGVVQWEFFLLFPCAWVVWVGLLFTLICRPGPTLADDRVGVARRVFGRTYWLNWRPAAEVRRLVVRHDGGPTGDLVGWLDDDALPLMTRQPVAVVRRVAGELAAAMGVPVADEDTRFTGTRAEQPVYSGVEADAGDGAEVFRLASVSIGVERPVTELKRFGPDFRQRLGGYALWALGVVWLLAYGGLGLGLIVWSSAEVLLHGHTSGGVSINGVTLPRDTPIPDLPTRLRTVAGPLLFALVVDVPLTILALWLGRNMIRAVRRTAAPAPVTRTVATRHRSHPATIALTADALALTHRGTHRWPWADIATVVARQVERSSGEDGGTVLVEWLELRFTSGEIWRLHGADAADCEWIATRSRSAGGLPDPAPAMTGGPA